MEKKVNTPEPFYSERTSRVSRMINAPRKTVYQAFIDPKSIVQWLAPDNMRGEIHHFDAFEGGTFQMSLFYLGSGLLAFRRRQYLGI